MKTVTDTMTRQRNTRTAGCKDLKFGNCSFYDVGFPENKPLSGAAGVENNNSRTKSQGLPLV